VLGGSTWIGSETCRYFQGLKVVAWLDHLKRKDDDRCLGCWQLMAHAGRGRGESNLRICWWMFAHTMGDDRMLLVLVMGCCWLVGVAHKRRRDEDDYAVNGRVGRKRQKFCGFCFFP